MSAAGSPSDAEPGLEPQPDPGPDREQADPVPRHRAPPAGTPPETHSAPQEAGPPDGEADPGKETRRLLLGALTVTLLVIALHFTPLRQLADWAQRFKAEVDAIGWKAHAGFFLVSVLAITLGFPRLLLCGIGGILFGFAEGFLLAQCAGVTGSYGTFLLTRRWAPHGWIARKLANRGRLRKLLARPGLLGIFVARQLPVPGLVLNVLLGVLPTRHRTFLLGTFIGYLPSNLPVALAGSSMGKESLGKALSQASASMLLLALSGLLVMAVRRKYGGEAGSGD